MIEFLDKDVTLQTLNREVAALGIPGFIGMGRFGRRQDEAGTWRSSERYLIAKFAQEIDSEQEVKILRVIDAHVLSRKLKS